MLLKTLQNPYHLPRSMDSYNPFRTARTFLGTNHLQLAWDHYCSGKKQRRAHNCKPLTGCNVYTPAMYLTKHGPLRSTIGPPTQSARNAVPPIIRSPDACLVDGKPREQGRGRRTQQQQKTPNVVYIIASVKCTSGKTLAEYSHGGLVFSTRTETLRETTC